LLRIAASRHEVVLAISQPDRPRGRGRKRSASPVSRAAEEQRIELLRVERVGEPACIEALRASDADLGVVVAFGQFLPKPVREFPRLGFLINAHASLLPRHRGAAPIAHAILCGDRFTGISVMRVEREMDAGPVMLIRETAIDPDENAGQLADRLGDLAADACVEALDQIATGAAQWREQDAELATVAPKLGREDARLDWSQDAESLARRVRAMAPSPGAFSSLDGEPLRILAARAQPGNATGHRPGSVRRDGPEPLRIATGDGWLVPATVQRAGGRALAIEEFLRGRSIPEGKLLGSH
jgi:methionyl-tRNA formyltransferase